MTREPQIDRLREELLIEALNAVIDAKAAEIELLREALKEIEWSNDSKWQADRARAALERKP